MFEYLRGHNKVDVDIFVDGIDDGGSNSRTGVRSSIVAYGSTTSTKGMVQHVKSHHTSFDFLEQHFTNGNSIETTLYDIFQVTDAEGNYIYPAAVSID